MEGEPRKPGLGMPIRTLGRKLSVWRNLRRKPLLQMCALSHWCMPTEQLKKSFGVDWNHTDNAEIHVQSADCFKSKSVGCPHAVPHHCANAGHLDASKVLYKTRPDETTVQHPPCLKETLSSTRKIWTLELVTWLLIISVNNTNHFVSNCPAPYSVWS